MKIFIKHTPVNSLLQTQSTPIKDLVAKKFQFGESILWGYTRNRWLDSRYVIDSKC